MDGFINLHKPVGISSNSAVVKIRKILGQKKIGHSGTLDPGAAGVLVLGVNKGTRLLQYLLDSDKQYTAELTFGYKTDTGDSEGNVIEEKPYDFVTQENLENTIKSFLGKIQQIPPMTSAIKINGKKLYEFARKGQVVDRPPREVEIKAIKLISFKKEKDALKAELDIKCSKGTYIRTLCEDIAEKIGTVGFMSNLLRTGVGNFHINNAYKIEQIENMVNEGNYNFMLPLDSVLNERDFLKYTIDEEKLSKVLNGTAIPTSLNYENRNVAIYTHIGQFIALGTICNGLIKINKVFK